MNDLVKRFLELSFDLLLFVVGITILIMCINGVRDTIKVVEPESRYVEYNIP